MKLHQLLEVREVKGSDVLQDIRDIVARKDYKDETVHELEALVIDAVNGEFDPDKFDDMKDELCKLMAKYVLEWTRIIMVDDSRWAGVQAFKLLHFMHDVSMELNVPEFKVINKTVRDRIDKHLKSLKVEY